MKKKHLLIPGLLILIALLFPGCAKTAPQPHAHTWENRKCVTCGEEKEIQKLGNWEYVLWKETGTMEMVSFYVYADLIHGLLNYIDNLSSRKTECQV